MLALTGSEEVSVALVYDALLFCGDFFSVFSVASVVIFSPR